MLENEKRVIFEKEGRHKDMNGVKRIKMESYLKK